jgi:Undecaprenyl-phosphate glucose phosphotransferase
VPAVTHELSLEAGAVREVVADGSPNLGIARNGSPVGKNTFDTPQSGRREPDFQRPAWLSPEIMGFAIAAVDWCMVLAAAAAGYAVYSDILDQTLAEPGRHVLTSILAALLFAGVFKRLGGYQLRQLSRLHWQLMRILMVWGGTVSVVLLIAFLSKTSETYSRGWAMAWILATPILIITERFILHAAMATQAGSGYLARKIAIVGAGDEGRRLITSLREEQDKSVVIRGVFDDRKSRLPASVCGLSVCGTTDDLLSFARRTPIDEVILALPLHAEQRLRSLCDKMKELAIDVRLSIEPLTESFNARSIGYAGTIPMLELVNRPLKDWRAITKLAEDKLLAALLLILTGPLMVLIALLIKLDSPGPVFFVQKRFGFNNDVIRVLKFRTMHVERSDPSGAQRTVRNDPRVTRLGWFLRLLSFDELPQLINIIRGEMSLVGPRPHAVAMKAGDRLYCDAVEEYLHRHRVKPGITGWAQVNGLRGEVDTLAKARARVVHDLYYIEHWSLWLDFKIILRTVGILASPDDAY